MKLWVLSNFVCQIKLKKKMVLIHASTLLVKLAVQSLRI